MSEITDQRALFVDIGFNFIPPPIRENLLEKKEFREEYGFTTDGTVTFGKNISSFRRSVIFNAIRSAFTEKMPLR